MDIWIPSQREDAYLLMPNHNLQSFTPFGRSGNDILAVAIDIPLAYGVIELKRRTLLSTIQIIFEDQRRQQNPYLTTCKIETVAFM
jgi:hypothetical protein